MNRDFLDNAISPALWQAEADRHRIEIESWTDPFCERRRLGRVHPIQDFLFVYYRYSPAKLKRWHPGFDRPLLVDSETPIPSWITPQRYTWIDNDHGQSNSGFSKRIVCDIAKISSAERERLNFILDLLEQTQRRKPNFGCFGMHEWAMVYRGSEVRHEQTTPMRLPQEEIDRFVESRPINCSHFDAFRFFAIDAKPLNRLQPTLLARAEQEQPGCIHANMDLYKWAFKAMPWIGGNLLKECFQLAAEAREIDMRASPYDLSCYGPFDPIKIETPEGRIEYETEQRQLSQRASEVREKLIQQLQSLVDHFESIPPLR